MIVIALRGCSPSPLAHYLKAVGILRLVSEQADAKARGFWRNEAFSLASKLNCDELQDFFLHRYQPTPLIAPWNGGSGFFPKDKKDGIDAIANSTASRLASYRHAIAAARAATHQMSQSPKNEDKSELLAKCRRTWRGGPLDWLNAAFVLVENGEPSYPALLGTGGNDGRLDFTNNFMQRLAEIFDCADEDARPRSGMHELLESALFDGPCSGLQSAAVGQFNPGGAGGANSSTGFGGEPLVNPWDFLLMLEGAIAFAAGVSRRTSREQLPKAAAPFAVYESAAGFASGVDGEKSRGEQWMPLWKPPLTYRELTSMLGEARCQVGGKPAKRPVEMARAVARLGIARGISEFERYGFIERNGQSNLATPLGRWVVPDSPPPHQELLDQIEDWVDRLRTKAGGQGAPASIGRAARRCENAMMQCCRPGADAADWRELLTRLGEAESQLVRSPGFTGSAGLQPLGAFGRLSAGWLSAAGAQSPELRLALALAGAHGTRSGSPSLWEVRTRATSEPGAEEDPSSSRQAIVWNPADPVRQHFMPLDTSNDRRFPTKFDVSNERLAINPSVVCVTADLQRDLVRLLRRRLIIARQNGDEYFPLTGVPGTEASLTDVLAIISGQVNEAEVLALAKPLMALNWSQVSRQAASIRDTLGTPSLSEDRHAADSLGVYGLFRLCHHWRSVETAIATHGDERRECTYLEHAIRMTPAILTHLAQGNLASATKLAVNRLKTSGLMPHINRAVGNRRFARRLAMSLAFPINQANIRNLAQRVMRPEIKPEPEEVS